MSNISLPEVSEIMVIEMCRERTKSLSRISWFGTIDYTVLQKIIFYGVVLKFYIFYRQGKRI